MAIGNEAIQNRFGTHGGDDDVTAQHEALRGACIAFAEYLDMILPDGRTKEVTFDQFKTASMWAHFALAEQAPVVDQMPGKHAKSRPVPVPPRKAVPQ